MLTTDFRAALLFAGVMTLCFSAQTISQSYGYSIGPFIFLLLTFSFILIVWIRLRDLPRSFLKILRKEMKIILIAGLLFLVVNLILGLKLNYRLEFSLSSLFGHIPHIISTLIIYNTWNFILAFVLGIIKFMVTKETSENRLEDHLIE